MKTLVFLDANIFRADPLFKSSTGQLLLSLQEEGAIELWSSSIAVEEAIHKVQEHYVSLEESVTVKFDEMRRLNEEFQAFLPPDRAAFTQFIAEFYRTHPGLKIISPTEEEYARAVTQSIQRIPPFFAERKEEFRDALIWLGALRLAKERPEASLYLVTSNLKDFGIQGRDELHPALKIEATANVSLVKDLFQLFEKQPSLKAIKATRQFKQWFDEQETADAAIIAAVNKYAWNQIGGHINKQLMGLPADRFFADASLGYIIPRFTKDDFKLIRREGIEFYPTFAAITMMFDLPVVGDVYLPDQVTRRFTMQYSAFLGAEIRVKFSFGHDLLFQPAAVEVVKIELADLPKEP